MFATHTLGEWIAFAAIITIMLVLDLGVFHKKTHKVSIKESLIWTVVWITLAMCFNFWIYKTMGPQKGLEFFTGYVIEKCLSIDNIFVISMIFSFFKIPSLYQHRVLFWGVLGALFFRMIFVIAGVALIQKFSWMIFVFGGFLIFTGFKMLKGDQKEVDFDQNPLVKFVKKIGKVTPELHGEKFLIKDSLGVRHFTPLFLVLVLIEATDVLFAVDSIPAILAITPDPYIVFTSNVFAILGLRSLYFAINGIMEMFEYINYALSGILVFVGVKMVISHWYHVPVGVSISVIFSFIIISVIASLMFPSKNKKA